jgi:ATP-dependent Lon protease
MTSETNAANVIDTSLDDLLNRHFAGRVVRKDLTKLVKEGANVPVYVLEYLLGSYCASNDEEVIRDGLQTVKRILAENYVRPDEAEKVKSTIRERGSLKLIDKVTVSLNEKRDIYEALLANLGVKGVEVSSSTVKQYEKLLVGGIWCIVTLEYFFEEGQKGSPFILRDLKPIQMPNMDLEELFVGRRAFTEEQWIMVLACPHDSAGREQLQRLRAWAARHREKPYLQRNQPEQHLDLRRPNHRSEFVLQHGATHGWFGGIVGCRRLRRSSGNFVQGQRRRTDHEGLHGLAPLPGVVMRSMLTPQWSLLATSTSRSIPW